MSNNRGANMVNLGHLEEIKDLREVWPHEALDFTPWLAEENNLALLADAVGLEILPSMMALLDLMMIPED